MKAIPYLLLCLAVPIAVQVANAQDKKGCKDSPLVSRFPGSVISDCKDKADDHFDFSLYGAKYQTVEGEFHYLDYGLPATASKAQVARNMNTALRNAGYTMVYENGSHDKFVAHMGKSWIQIEMGNGAEYWETIVTETTLTQDVVANAAALTTGLSANGHIVVKGILFDTAKADVKPESNPAIEQVAKMLAADPKLKVYVVGHTDNVGALAGNLDLSKRRAAAVVQMLITQYHVAADRLAPYGDGPCAPIQSNDTEDCRALNRRVELVKQ